MKLSIVVPVYNVEDYLAECLKSILDQKLTNYEIICVNDGSTDKSFNVLKKISEKYKEIRIINQENKGLSGARNTGIKNSTGEYILFLDSDDFFSGKLGLDKALKIIKKNDLEVLAFNYFIFYEDSGKKVFKDFGDTGLISGEEFYKFFNKNKFLPVSWRFLFKREFLESNRLSFQEGLIFEDHDFFTKFIFNVKKMRYIDEKIISYRIRTGSITNTSVNQKKIDSYEFLIDNFLKISKNKDEEIKGYLVTKSQYFLRQIIKGKMEKQTLKTNFNNRKILEIIPMKSSLVSKLKLLALLFQLNLKINFSKS